MPWAWFDSSAAEESSSTATGVPVDVFGGDLIAWYAGGYSAGVWPDQANGNNGTALSGNPTGTTTPGGNDAVSFNGTSHAILLGDATYLDGRSSFTIWACFKGGAQSAYAALVSKAYSSATIYLGGDGSGYSLQAEAGTFASDPAVSAASPFDSTWHRAIWVVSGGVGTLYIDGVAEADTQASGGTVANITEQLAIGAGSDGASGAFYFSGEISNVGIAIRNATSGEVSTLDAYLDEWINGATSAISGTTTLTFGSSSALTGAGALAGSSSLTFGQTAALAGTGALAGSSTITFAQTAALVGTGALVGSSTLTFGQSGTATATGALAGSSTITFGQTATLTGAGVLAGSAALTFGQSATLAGSGALAASTTLTFDATGDLTSAGSGAMDGSAALAFSAAATLVGAGALVGASTVTFASTATLAGSVAAVGSTTLTFAASGTLVALAGTPVIVAEHTSHVYVCPATESAVYLPSADAASVYVCPAAESLVYLPSAEASAVMSQVIESSEVEAA